MMNDKELLYNFPLRLIEKYQNIIEIVVSNYIKTGSIKRYDKDDYIQDINEKLIKKMTNIQKNYNGNFLLSTYLASIVNNICLKKIYKDNTNNVNKPDNKQINSSENVLKEILISQEISKLDTFLRLYYYKKNKIKLCLKLIYRIPVCYNDFVNYSNKINKFIYNRFIKEIRDITNLKNKDIYEVLSKLFSNIEKKKYSSESVRKWIHLRIDELITLMNGASGQSNYTKETFQYLVEYFFMYKPEKNKVENKSIKIVK